MIPAQARSAQPVDDPAVDWVRIHEFMLKQLAGILPVEAPPGAEGARADWVMAQVRDMGFEPERDGADNVLVRCRADRAGPWLVVDAHLDTVFPTGTFHGIEKRNSRWSAPGVYDDGAGLAVLWGLLAIANAHPDSRFEDVMICFSTGEEGIGNLRGMRGLCADREADIRAMVHLDGALGSLVVQAVGSRRYALRVRGPGGHSWNDFGRPSAIHRLADWIAWYGASFERTETRSWNVGRIEGGTSINTIAAEAFCRIEIRSSHADELAQTDTELRAALADFPWEPDVKVDLELIGDRPAGREGAAPFLADAAANVHREMGIHTRRTSGSTNANWPVSLGIPAVTLGVGCGGGAHTCGEWLDVASLSDGVRMVYRLLGRLQDTREKP